MSPADCSIELLDGAVRRSTPTCCSTPTTREPPSRARAAVAVAELSSGRPVRLALITLLAFVRITTDRRVFTRPLSRRGRFLAWCEARGLRVAGDRAAPRGGLYPDAPGVRADGEAAPGGDPGRSGAGGEPGRVGAGAEARRDEGRDAGADAGGDRGGGDASSGLLPARAQGVVLVLVGASAVAQNICDPNWLRTASGSDVRALIRGGADVNRVCNSIRNRPLHQAILPAGVSPDVVQARVEAGADILAENIDVDLPRTT